MRRLLTIRPARAWLIVQIGLILLIFLPRLFDTGRFLTTDEYGLWLGYTSDFRAALVAGDLAGTATASHYPGVTVNWLGALGWLLLDRLAGWFGPLSLVDSLRALRVPIALAQGACVLIGYALLRRLIDRRVALVAALLWATDPFLIAHSRIFGVDGLLASFVTVAVLFSILAFSPINRSSVPKRVAGGGWRVGRRIITRHPPPEPAGDAEVTGQALPPTPGIAWLPLIGAGVFVGLAALTKLPGVLLLPWAGLLVLLQMADYLREHTSGSSGERREQLPEPGVLRPRSWAASLITLCLIAGVAALTWLTLYPAAWVDPVGTVGLLRAGLELGQRPHEIGNFFAGRPVDDPGPWFYPVAVALRLTPWALIGLALSVIGLMFRRYGPAERRLVLGLLLFVGLYLMVMSLAPKKFDRYALPVFPAINVLAACGAAWVAALWRGGASLWPSPPVPLSRARERGDALQRDARNGDSLRGNDPPLSPSGEESHTSGGVREGRVARSNLRAAPFALILTLALGLHAALYHPHQLTYYNPLVGGGPAAERLILVGWGEGLELAGDYISAQPDGCARPVAAWASFLLEPFVCSEVISPQHAEDPERAGYTVFYISQLQRGYDRASFERFMARGKPAHVVYLNGIAYVYVFRIR